ncbi:hypothetical protein Bca101_046535 [Brassica carinata]
MNSHVFFLWKLNSKVGKRHYIKHLRALKRFRFEIDMLEGSWYKKIIGALKIIQGVSFTIDAPSQMVYMCGNIEEGLLMKMLTKTGIQILGVDYGNLKPPPKKVEAQILDGTTGFGLNGLFLLLIISNIKSLLGSCEEENSSIEHKHNNKQLTGLWTSTK